MHCTRHLFVPKGTYPWQFVVPAEDVDADQREDPGQRRQNLFGNVVGGVQPQVGILQDLDGPSHQLDQGQPRHAIHDDVGHSLPNSRFRATVIGQHSPVQKHLLQCTQRQIASEQRNCETSPSGDIS